MIVLSLLILACSIYAEMSGRYRQMYRKHGGDSKFLLTVKAAFDIMDMARNR